MALHLTQYRNGFSQGLTWITRYDEAEDNTGIAMGVHKLHQGERYTATAQGEMAWLLMEGKVRVQCGNLQDRFSRHSLFDESASALHLAKGTEVVLEAESDAELTIYQTSNAASFPPRLYQPRDVPNEHRGKGQVGDTCYRFVRTIFDRSNADPKAELVLGEVITMPGRWSSYPPHHHPQPEIYHYRFTKPQGYGHAELGERVLKVHHYDTVKIFDGLDHPQCAAPGYGMYYAWVIRHLPDRPYTVPEFTEAHRWIMDPKAEYWQPKDAQ